MMQKLLEKMRWNGESSIVVNQLNDPTSLVLLAAIPTGSVNIIHCMDRANLCHNDPAERS